MASKYLVKRERWKNGYWLTLRDKENGKLVGYKKWSSNPVIRSNAYNQLRTNRVRRYWEGKAPVTKKSQKAFHILQQMQKKYDAYPSVETIKKQIKKEGVKNFNVNVRSGKSVDNTKLIRTYQRILKGKVPQGKVKDVIIHRKKTLKNRLAMKILLFMKGEARAEITVSGILLEHDADAYNFWQDRWIDSNAFDALAGEFRSYLGNPKTFITHQYTNKAGTINRVQTGWSIA